MAAYLLMVSALITASAAAADAKTDEALFEASASCVAYHVFATSQMDPVSEEAKLSEEEQAGERHGGTPGARSGRRARFRGS